MDPGDLRSLATIVHRRIRYLDAATSRKSTVSGISLSWIPWYGPDSALVSLEFYHGYYYRARLYPVASEIEARSGRFDPGSWTNELPQRDRTYPGLTSTIR